MNYNNFPNGLNLTLFESTSANFKLSVNCMFKQRSQTTQELFSFITASQAGNIESNPKVFLVFAYTEGTFESQRSIFTSNPHLLRIRSIFEEMKNALFQDKAFVQTDSGLVVAEEYAEPYSIANIGRKEKWISFKFSADALVNENDVHIPAVEIALTDAPKSCILTIDEFLSLYTIINDISLPNIAMEATVLSFAYNSAASTGTNSGATGQTRGYQSNGYNRGGYSNNYNRPNYNQNQSGYRNNSYQQQQPNNEYMQVTNAAPQRATQAPNMNYKNNFGTAKVNVQQMPPRSAAPQAAPKAPVRMDAAAIESVPVDDLDLGDEGLNDLFND